MAHDIAYLRNAGSRCVNDTLIAIKMEQPGVPKSVRAYEMSVRDLCDQELGAVRQWQPPAPQPGPQAVVAERVRRELWALKLDWMRAMTGADGYVLAAMTSATTPPGNPGAYPAQPATVVVKADQEERVLETRLRRERGATPAGAPPPP
jgi:hypothetical protein